MTKCAPPDDISFALDPAGRGLRFVGATALTHDLGRITRDWRAARPPDGPPVVTITGDDGRFRLTGAGRDGTRALDAVNAVCDIVAAVARHRAETDLTRLYLHTAGVDIGGRLILFPATRRAGKSLLSAALARAGHRIFSDDVIAVSVDDTGAIVGEGLGAAPRLRLPLPANLSDEFADWCHAQTVLSNKQYAYLSPDLIAAPGETLPIGGVVFLDRQDAPDIRPFINPADTATEMAALLHQNFARAVHSGDVLTMLGTLADEVPVVRLSYADPVDAAAALSDHVQHSDPPIAGCPTLSGRDLRPAEFGAVAVQTGTHFVRDPAAEMRRVGDRLHMSDAQGRALHQFDAITEAVWGMMERPTSVDDIADAMVHAFPDVAADQLHADAASLIERLRSTNLIVAA